MRRIALWAGSAEFRECWRAFGKEATSTAAGRDRWQLASFERTPQQEFVDRFNPDNEGPVPKGFAEFYEKARALQCVYCIVLQIGRVKGGADSRREVRIYGHPTVCGPLYVAELFASTGLSRAECN